MNSDPRHRAQFRQLWIDKVRDQLDKASTSRQLDYGIKFAALALLTGIDRERIPALPPEELAIQLQQHDLVDPLPVVAMRALKTRGYPQRELTIAKDWLACHVRVGAALTWSSVNILRSPDTQIMLLDDRTGTEVAHSKNGAITAAELQHLPHNPCLIEFYRPIEIAEFVKRGVRVRAVGFQAIGDTDAPAAAVCFYLDYWDSSSRTGARWPATIDIWFGGFNVVNIDEAARIQIGFPGGSVVEAAITEVCKQVARNLWDFVTSRSIRYEQVRCRPVRRSAHHVGAKRDPENHSDLERQVTLLFLSRDSISPGLENGDSRVERRPWDHRIEIPGTFHEYVYCAKCGDLHRHDLLGQGCRKCGEIVGPRANLRVEKYWHSPYVKGPESAPLKDVVRELRHGKRRRDQTEE